MMVGMNSRFKREIVTAEPANQDPIAATTLRVTLDQLEPYDKNPRRSENPNRASIKASILNRGLDHPPNITRRPGSDNYMIRDGGNTRLQILKELWEETGDPRFFELDCRFHPWTGELHALAGHMVENEQRGHMLFIERAIAAKEIEALILEQDGVEEISQRELARRITAEGWTLNQGNLSVMMYAESQLYPHIPDAFWGGLGRDAVKKIRRLQGACETYWLSLEPDGEDGFELVFNECLSHANHSDFGDFDFTELEQLLYSRTGDALEVKGIGIVAAEVSAILAGAKPSGQRGVQMLPPRSREEEIAATMGGGRPPAGAATAPATTSRPPGSTGHLSSEHSAMEAPGAGAAGSGASNESGARPSEHGTTPPQPPTEGQSLHPFPPSHPAAESSQLGVADLPGLRQRAFDVASALAARLDIENSVIQPSSVEGVPDGWGFTLEYPELMRGNDGAEKTHDVQNAQLGLWMYLLNLRYAHPSKSDAERHLEPSQVSERVFRRDVGLRMAAGCWSVGMRLRGDEIRTLMDELEAVIRAIRAQILE